MFYDLFDYKQTPEDPIYKLILKNDAKYIKKPKIYGLFGKIAKKETQLKVPPNHILWGVSERNYDEAELVTTDWSNRDSFGALFLGMRGMGKSVLMRNILLDQMHERFGHYVFAIDPKQVDFSKIDRKQNDPTLIELLNKLGMRPKAYKVKRMIPKVMLFADEQPPPKTQVFVISMADIGSLSPQDQMNTISYLLGLKQFSPAGESLQRVLSQFNNAKLRPKELRNKRRSTKLFAQLIIEDIREQNIQRKSTQSEETLIKRRSSSTKLYFSFKDLIQNFAIGDPSRKNKLKVDFVKELVEKGVVVLVANLDMESERYSNVYIKVILSKLIKDVMAFRQNKTYELGRGMIDKPVVVAVDEADVLAPGDVKTKSPSRSMLLQLLTKYRYYGFSVLMATQDPKLIWNRIVKQCKYIVTPKVINDDQAKLLRERGVPDYTIDNVLRKLYAGDEKPVQWALIEPDTGDEPKLFYPIAPMTAIPKESDNPEDNE